MLWDAVAVLEKTLELFGTWEEVCHWLLQRMPALGGARPVDLLGTEEGCEKVLTLINQLETGAYV